MTAIVESLNRRVARESAHRAWRTLRAGMWVLLGLVVIFSMGDDVEATLYPPLRSQFVQNVQPAPDGRLCWDWGYFKRQGIFPVSAYAELYIDDNPYPIFVGLENRDGMPFGAGRATNPGSAYVSTCVHVPKQVKPIKRLGVQGHVTYQPQHRLWTLPVKMPWVDYYVSHDATVAVGP